MLNVTMTQWAKVAYIAVSLVAVLITSVIAYRVIRGLVRAIGGSGSVFGTDGRSRVIGFGLASLLFPRVVPELVRLTVALFVGIFSDLPVSLMTQYQRAMQYCPPQPATELLDQCLSELGLGLANAWGRGLDYWYGDKVRQFPFADFMLMLAAWAILAQLFAPVPVREDGEKSRMPWLQDAYTRLSLAGRQNLRFFIVLAIAGYFSIAAIAAIPTLRESAQGASSLPPAALERAVAKRLDPVDVTQLENENPFSPLMDVPRSASDATGTPPVTAPSGAAGDPQPAAGPSSLNMSITPAAVTQTLTDLAQQRRDLIGQLAQLIRNADRELQKAQAMAVTTYDANSAGRRGTREQAEHYQGIITWYGEAVGMFESRISECQSAITAMDSVWRQWAESEKRKLGGGGTNVPQTFALDNSGYEQYSKARDACQRPARVVANVPPRPALGAYLGPFGFVASWLVRTESLPLALVVGLLGFGLLGSACSTFVREQKIGGDDEILVKNLPGVIIRGLSAAIVVFLAVEGGLAIFAGGTADPSPNPYVLLLTCLIGAVFSEQVWEWAQRKLRDNFANDPRPNEPNANTQAADAATNGSQNRP